MTSHASLLPARTPRKAFGKLLTAEAKYQWRVPAGLFFGVGVPLIFIVIFGLIPAANNPDEGMGGLSVFAAYFPSLLLLSLISLAVGFLPEHLADYRQQGILRRIGTTPVPPAWMLAAQVIVNLALIVVGVIILVVAGTAGFGLGAPGHLAGFVLALALSIAALFAIGLWISAIARNTGAAQVLGWSLFFPLLFFAGMMFPRSFLPEVVLEIGNWTPSGAAVQALTDSMAGTFPSAQALLVLSGWALLFGFLALRFFRWE